MNKLEPYHIAPYLPYKLMWYQKGFPLVEQIDFNTKANYAIKSLKPVLRPLSDLTNETNNNT